MITGITIENFMAFRKRQVVPIRPITLVFGPNSSGKSSIFRALAALKHVSETHGDGEPDLVKAEWSSMRLGGWQNLIHQHVGDGEIRLGLKNPRLRKLISLTRDSLFLLGDNAKEEMRHRDRMKVEEEERIWTLGREAQGGPAQIRAFEQAVDGRRPLKMVQENGAWVMAGEGDGISILKDDFARQLAILILDPFETKTDWNQFEDSIKRFRQLINDFSTEIKPLFLDDHYEKPLVDVREMLEEFMYGIGGGPEYLWNLDYHLKFEEWHEVGRLEANRHDLISLLQDAANQPDFLGDLWHFWCYHCAQVNLKCGELSDWIHLDPIRRRPDYPLTFGGIPDSPEATPWRSMLCDEAIRERASSMLSDITEGEYRIGIRYRSSSVSRADDATATELQKKERELCFVRKDESSHSPSDLGYGISTLLPIIAALSSEREKLISIEQPELHIHPRLQARLGDLLIQSAKGGQSSYDVPGPENRFLIETHSEHLILRLLRRIRETTEEEMDDWPDDLKKTCPDGITPDDVAVLYVEPGEEGATVKEMRIDDFGEFRDKWPGGFFEERAREIF